MDFMPGFAAVAASRFALRRPATMTWLPRWWNCSGEREPDARAAAGDEDGVSGEIHLSVPVITPTARRDIRAIYRYIAEDSVHYAHRVAEAILATCQMTAELPGIGHARPDLTHRDILFVPVTGYERYGAYGHPVPIEHHGSL
jgi:plasmid stabilization system protein ParE